MTLCDFGPINVILLEIMQEEKEKRLEELFESEIDNEDRHGPMEEIPEEGVAAALAGKKTIDILSAADSIIDALEVAEDEKNRHAAYEVGIVTLFIYTYGHDTPLVGALFFANLELNLT